MDMTPKGASKAVSPRVMFGTHIWKMDLRIALKKIDLTLKEKWTVLAKSREACGKSSNPKSMILLGFF